MKKQEHADLSEILLNFQKSCKNTTESSYISVLQFPHCLYLIINDPNLGHLVMLVSTEFIPYTVTVIPL